MSCMAGKASLDDLRMAGEFREMKYEWKNNFRCKTDAQVVGELCEELESTIGLTAENLLDVSRAEDAPLHNEFEWVDDVAAEKYRTYQARLIINHLAISVGESKEESVRAFFTTEEKKYESLEVILRCEDKKRNLLEVALAELERFRRKYAQLEELASVFDAIDDVKKGA